MILAHRIELDPTEKQKEYFRQACGTARFVWNWALEEWNYRYDLGANTDACEIKRYFNSFKYEAFPWISLGEKHLPRILSELVTHCAPRCGRRSRRSRYTG